MKKQREEMSDSNNSKSNRRFKARVIRPKSKSEIDNGSDDSISITIASLKKPSRRSRSKTKKPKFLSLRLQLSPTEKSESQMPPLLTSSITTTAVVAPLDLFPLHQEKSVEEKDNVLPPEHDAISRYFFTSTDGNATTLTGLLTAAASEGAAAAKEIEDEEAASRYTWGTGGNSGSGEGSTAAEQSLVRTAMRNREREVSEVEKWVSISEVVEEERKRKGKSKEEEVSSRWCEGVDLWRGKCGDGGGVGLKLDYEEVLNAWSDKGRCSLYIGDGSQQVLLESPQPLPPQTVPEMADDYFFFGGGANFGAANGGLWTVPEITCNAKGENGREGGNSTKLGQREASVLRYKEKRQSRLFAKKIRYEVRKLNAEKRPRIKGRFVKRS